MVLDSIAEVVQHVNTHLSALPASVEAGHEGVIPRADLPVARLVPLAAAAARTLGVVAYRVPEDLVEALPEEELMIW